MFGPGREQARMRMKDSLSSGLGARPLNHPLDSRNTWSRSIQSARPSDPTTLCPTAMTRLAGRGYVYFPGFSEKWYSQNVGTIFRCVEGEWFLSRPVWDTTVEPLIANASECDA